MLVALVVLAGPVMLTNAYVAVEQVDRDAVEAARAMGMTAWQVLTRVELPLASPLIFAGRAHRQRVRDRDRDARHLRRGRRAGRHHRQRADLRRTAGVIAGSLTIIVLAFAVDGLLALVQRAVTPPAAAKRGRLGRAERVVRAVTATEDVVVQQS